MDYSYLLEDIIDNILIVRARVRRRYRISLWNGVELSKWKNWKRKILRKLQNSVFLEQVDEENGYRIKLP